jgi:hypothetical protein
MSAGATMFVISFRMRDQQALHDPADRRPCARPKLQVELILEQAVAIKRERLSPLKVAQSLKKGFKVASFAKDCLPVVSPIDDVVD